MVNLVLENQCSAPVLLRNFRASEAHAEQPHAYVSQVANAELPCIVDAGSPDRCLSLQQGESLKYDLSRGSEAMAFQFSWDEEQQLGWQLPCNNYTFCQGLETQSYGKSLNFDNQLGYSLPLDVAFLAGGKDKTDCTHAGRARCDFDTHACGGHTLRAFDPYGPAPPGYPGHGAKGFSHEYCVAPDANRACISTPSPARATGNPDAAQCAQPASVWCSDPPPTAAPGEPTTGQKNCTDSWCAPRADAWDAINAAAQKRKSSPATPRVLDKVLLKSTAAPGGFVRATEAQFLAAFSGGALDFQEQVNLACSQGATRNYTGSLSDAAPQLDYPAAANIRVPNSRGEGAGFAVTYECDGVNQFVPRSWLQQQGYPDPAPAGAPGLFAWLKANHDKTHPPPGVAPVPAAPDPPTKVDMAANVGMICTDHDTVKVTFCPGGGPHAEDEPAVRQALQAENLGIRPCSEFAGWDHTFGNCSPRNQTPESEPLLYPWACPAHEVPGQWKDWACGKLQRPFDEVQKGGGCEEYCRFAPAQPLPTPTPGPTPAPTGTCSSVPWAGHPPDGGSCQDHLTFLQQRSCATSLAKVEQESPNCGEACHSCDPAEATQCQQTLWKRSASGESGGSCWDHVKFLQDQACHGDHLKKIIAESPGCAVCEGSGRC